MYTMSRSSCCIICNCHPHNVMHCGQFWIKILLNAQYDLHNAECSDTSKCTMLNANCNVVSLVPISGGFSPGWFSKPGDLFQFKQASLFKRALPSIGFLSNLKDTFCKPREVHTADCIENYTRSLRKHHTFGIFLGSFFYTWENEPLCLLNVALPFHYTPSAT